MKDSKLLRLAHPALPSLVKNLENQPSSRRHFLRTATLLGVSAGSAYTLASTILGDGLIPVAAAQAPETQRAQILRVAMTVPPIVDPAKYEFTEMANITRHICENLTVSNADGITLPQLAERWQASEDLKTWTFYLRRDAQWHNGDSFDVDDVLFNINRWLSPTVGSANLGAFSALTESFTYGGTTAKRKRAGSLERVDRFTFRLHLAQPTLSIPENFAAYFAGIVHRDFKGNFGEVPNGTGAYRLAEYEEGNKAVLKRSGKPYWGPQPTLDEIHYYDTGDSPVERLEALARGEVDMVYSMDVRTLDLANSLPDTSIYEIKSSSTGVARMNVNQPPFDNIDVRRAVMACIDPSAFPRQAFNGRGGIAEHHHVGPMHPEYYELPRPAQDYDKARELLKLAGHGAGLNITIDCGNTNGLWQQSICQIIREQLAPAGINLNVNIISKSDYWKIWKTTPFGITTWGHRSLGIMTLNLAYRTGVPWNETGYSSAAFDAALDTADSLIDVDKRREAMKDVQQILQDDAIIIQPVWRPAFFVARDYVKGLVPNASRLHHFENVTLV
jgi:peptide/nickel transport system substrate-binding protein